MTLARSSTVPYIAAWSGEPLPDRQLTYTSMYGGLSYVDEKPDDRAYGALWNRRDSAPGTGSPRFGEVHPRRQLEAMRNLLCQVCGEPADENDDGVLWLLEDCRGDWNRWPNDLMTTHPPVCRQHALEAAAACPHLAAGSVTVRVGESEECAVHGRTYGVDKGLIVPLRREVVELDSPRLRWTLAGQLLRHLSRCKIVDLAAEDASPHP